MAAGFETFAWSETRSRARWVLAAAAAVAAVSPIPVIAPHLDEAPYMGIAFVVLTAACGLVAATALWVDSGAVYAAALTTCSLAVVGYIATRSMSFPELGDDVGDWFEPLGVVSVCAETIAVCAAGWGLSRALRSPAPTGPPPPRNPTEPFPTVPSPPDR
ncbi:hypothetical protein [Tsukamurella sp. 8J]|uniref:hypothetical protein n=1 Tax=Tsukamurella sp. 8J TaxID=3031962 RepID=UPI0023B97818|nr:hypothetical protein [Tsukamurella sp. 8J]MDF0529337.1 hypothetical protein [Tsukamurella sp. 8J]